MYKFKKRWKDYENKKNIKYDFFTEFEATMLLEILASKNDLELTIIKT